jgi:hypothetical protein
MKTQITIGVIVALAIASIAAAPSPKTITTKKVNHISEQPFAGFSSFKIHRQGKGVTATWGMTSESGLTCYTLQRTYFDPNDPFSPWDNICVIPCNSSRSYKWTDENVLAGTITYRVKADLNPTGEMYSGMESIRIVSH